MTGHIFFSNLKMGTDRFDTKPSPVFIDGDGYSDRLSEGFSSHCRDLLCRMTMVHKILVVYASRAGSTEEIAKGIGDQLSAAGLQVEVFAVSQVSDLPSFDAIVLGAPIYMGRVVTEFRTFVEDNRAMLESVPVAAFIVGGSLTDRSESSLAWARDLMEKALAPIRPLDIGFFAGRLATERMPLSQRFIVRCVWGKPGDFRDWAMIREWAGGLPGKFREGRQIL